MWGNILGFLWIEIEKKSGALIFKRSIYMKVCLSKLLWMERMGKCWSNFVALAKIRQVFHPGGKSSRKKKQFISNQNDSCEKWVEEKDSWVKYCFPFSRQHILLRKFSLRFSLFPRRLSENSNNKDWRIEIFFRSILLLQDLW